MKNNISFNSKLSKFGIGLFETIKIENEPIDFDLHMNRLYNSVRDLNIKIDIDKSTLKDKVLMYIKHNNIKNKALKNISEALIQKSELIIQENQKDIAEAKNNGIKESMVDRLLLNKERIESMAKDILKVIDFLILVQ